MQKPNQSNCRCVAIELCPSDVGLDLRIVNEVKKNAKNPVQLTLMKIFVVIIQRL